MFKLKPGNVFQKLNKMDRKQAYTIGAIVLVCFVALLTLASFLGNAEDTSFEDFNTRGYDLAQMPFLNDEAEEYLLASKYPDMQGNNSTMLYSAAEKEARQEEDAAAQEETSGEEETTSASDTGSSSYSGYSGYGGGYGGGRTATPTQVGKLSSASMGTASGSGVNATWGAPSGDFSPYKSQEKGSETPVQFKNQDARRALSQFAQGSRAAAGLRDSKGANAKKALMGGNIMGSEAFTDKGVDLSKTGGLAIDPNAPVSSSDLSNLDEKVADAAQDAKDKKEEFEQGLEKSFWEQLGERLMSGVVDIGLKLGGKYLDAQMDNMMANIDANSAFKDALREQSDSIYGIPVNKMTDEQFNLAKSAHPKDVNGNTIPWDQLRQDKSNQTAGAAWGGDTKSFYKGGDSGGMRSAIQQDTSSQAYKVSAEKGEAARQVSIGRYSGKGNILSNALNNQPNAPGGSSSNTTTTTTQPPIPCPEGKTLKYVETSTPGGYSVSKSWTCE